MINAGMSIGKKYARREFHKLSAPCHTSLAVILPPMSSVRTVHIGFVLNLFIPLVRDPIMHGSRKQGNRQIKYQPVDMYITSCTEATWV